MIILLDPVNRTRGGLKWPLVAHTVAIFVIDTVYTIINLVTLSFSYIDVREIQGADLDSPGPFGYLHRTYSMPTGLVSTTAFLLNNLLVDGLLVRFVFNPLIRMSNMVVPLALSLLRYVRCDPLGNFPSRPYVPRHSRYVTGSPRNVWVPCRLT